MRNEIKSYNPTQNYVNVLDDPIWSLNVYMLGFYVCKGLC